MSERKGTVITSDDAVSPVIGVILMVAITVILAAMIGIFVFSQAGNMETGKSVAVRATMSAGNVDLVLVGGQDLNGLEELRIEMPDLDGDSTGLLTLAGPFTVGQKITLEPETGDRLEGRLLVVGTFTDGAEKILLDQDF